MKMYIFYDKYHGDEFVGTYFVESWDELWSSTFNPEYSARNIHTTERISLKNDSYKVRQEYYRELGRMYQESFSYGNTYYWNDIAAMEAFLNRKAKRYGLVREFKENAVC